MQNKLKFNPKYHFNINTQICYTKNYCKSKALKYLQLHLYANLLIFFKIVITLFIKLEELYGDLHYNKFTMKKFKELKKGTRSFNAFYSKFIKLIAKFKFTKKILL